MNKPKKYSSVMEMLVDSCDDNDFIIQFAAKIIEKRDLEIYNLKTVLKRILEHSAADPLADSAMRQMAGQALRVESSIPKQRAKRGELTASIEKTIKGIRGTFSFKEVITPLRLEYPTLTNSKATHILRRLESQGKIELVERGCGKRPTKYQKIKK